MKELGDLPVTTGEWECAECGYIEDGSRGRKPKECPECGAPAQALEFFPHDDEGDLSWDDTSEADEDPDGDFEDEDVY